MITLQFPYIVRVLELFNYLPSHEPALCIVQLLINPNKMRMIQKDNHIIKRRLIKNYVANFIGRKN